MNIDDILAKIGQANDLELQEIMRAVERRYAAAYPDWEVVYMAVHKEPKQRAKDLAEIIAYMKREEKMDSLG